MNPVLTICKPTYNRKDVLIPDLESYLQLKDERFVVHVSDNGSTDGTLEELKRLSSLYSRFSYHHFKKNVGPNPNGIKSLSGAKSDYVFLLIDKDTIDLKVLSGFIDYLQTETPYFGYVNLSNDKEYNVVRHSAGVDASTNVGFRRGHPSGMFWRSDLFDGEIAKAYFTETDNDFDFTYDLIQGMLGLSYPGDVVYMPLVINENMRIKERLKTKSYNDDNFFFGHKMNMLALKFFLSPVLNSAATTYTKEAVIEAILKRIIITSTIGIKNLLYQEACCYHYNLTRRNVGIVEMNHNVDEIIRKTILQIKLCGIPIQIPFLRIKIKSYLRNIKCCIIWAFSKPEQRELTAG